MNKKALERWDVRQRAASHALSNKLLWRWTRFKKMGELFAIVKEMFEENMVANIKIISRTSLVFFPPHTIIHQILVIAQSMMLWRLE